MKKLILSGLILLFGLSAYPQEFPEAWKSKFSFKPDRWFYDGNAKYVLGRDDEQAEVLNGATGKSAWKLNFKNDLKVKTLARATYNAKEGVVLFYNEDDKKKNGEKIIVDLNTGKELWRGDAYAGTDADDNFHFANSVGYVTAGQTTIVFNNTTKKFNGLDLRTGKLKWESEAYPGTELSKNISISEIENSDFAQVFITNEDVLKTQILYMSIITGEVLNDDSRFASSSANYDQYYSGRVRIKRTVGKNTVRLVGDMKKLSTKLNFELKAEGDVNWVKKFEGSAVQQVFNEHPYVKLTMQGDKIIIISKSLSVFDLKTGNQLWEVPFDNCDVSGGLKVKQEFGIAGWPLAEDDFIYYVDLKNDNAIKKVDAQTGKMIWKSEKFRSNDRVPNLAIVNGVLVAQFGGMINTQIYIPNANGGVGAGVYKNENRFDGNFEVRAYDPASGKLLWNTSQLSEKLGDKFKDRISTIHPINNKIVVASGQNLFCLDPKTGAVVYKTSLAESKIGDIFEVLVSKDLETLHIFCDNGIATAKISDGKLNYATKTGEIFWKAPGNASYKFNYGDNMFVWVGESDFIGFDLDKGLVKGKMKDNSDPQMTDDGNYIFVRDGEKVTKFSVNK